MEKSEQDEIGEKKRKKERKTQRIKYKNHIKIIISSKNG